MEQKRGWWVPPCLSMPTIRSQLNRFRFALAWIMQEGGRVEAESTAWPQPHTAPVSAATNPKEGTGVFPPHFQAVWTELPIPIPPGYRPSPSMIQSAETLPDSTENLTAKWNCALCATRRCSNEIRGWIVKGVVLVSSALPHSLQDEEFNSAIWVSNRGELP